MPDQELAEFEALPAPDVESIDGSGGSREAMHRAIAREAAAAAMRNTSPAIEPGSTFKDSRRPAEAQPVLDEHGLETQPAEHDQHYTPEPVVPTTYTDYDSLRDRFGVAMPESLQTASPDIQQSVAQLAEVLFEAQSREEQAIRTAETANMRIQDFAKRLESEQGRRRVLLGIALNNPEAFEQTMETISRMRDDDAYATAVRESIESQIQLEAMQRETQARERATQTTRGQQVESHTVRLAKSLGIDEEFAKSQVVKQILHNQAVNGRADISFKEVSSLLGDLAKRSGARQPQPAVPRAPAAQQAQQAAPQVPATTPTTQPTQPAAPARRGPEPTDPMGKLRAAVKQSSERMRNLGV
jgi:hypothetical protein